MNIIEIIKNFKTEQDCIVFLENKRWSGKVICPYCKATKISKHTEQGRKDRHQCQSCTKSFSVTVGTIMHRTHLPLQKWLLAISMILNAKEGVSSRQLARDLDLPVKTAWSLSMRIRIAMKTEQKELLVGIFEMDETYLKNNKNESDDDNHKGWHSNKTHTPIIAFKKKDGDIKAFVSNDTTSATLSEIILKNIESGSEFHTDEYNTYKFTRKFWKHKSVNHSIEYVSADGIRTTA